MIKHLLKQGWGKIAPGAAAILVIPVLLLTLVYTPQRASAATTATAPARCSDTSWLLDDDWVSPDAKHYVQDQNGNKFLLSARFPNYKSSQFSMVIGQIQGAATGHHLDVVIIDHQNSDHFELTKDTTGYYLSAVTTSTTQGYRNAEVYDGNATNAPKAWPIFGVIGNNETSFTPPLKIAFTCISTVQNITYANGWDGPAFSTKLLYGTSTIQCDKLDIGCWISKAWNGVTDTFSSVGQALLSGIANLFAPDGDEIKAQFDDLNTTLTNHLGFLTYPFTFLANLFSAFTSSSSWCTSSSCTKNFGNFFGHSFTLDLNAMAETMPTVWSWFLGLVRGTTILALILAVRRKYMGVVGK